ncbi:NUDIX hydrolase [Pseudolysinimonas sp.]|uniref:NUDIX hydrolase n=1 Tax=Pseudolysinimonas sp. TaxID=2680009 RepID=UPI003F813B60
MAVPDFVLDLRARIGHAPLWLSGVTAVILDDARERVLLIRRSDNGAWTPVTGIIDPGEQPAVAAAREALEEAGVEIRVERLASTSVTGEVVYPNGDRSRYLDLTFACRHVAGDPQPVDGEASEVAWYALDALPEISPEMRWRIGTALEDGPARFLTE